jgi:hypothetical protein
MESRLTEDNEETIPVHATTLQPPLSLEEVCAQVRVITAEIDRIVERLCQMIERNKAWLARIQTLSCSLWLLCQ